jgi:hypothetical protein
VVCVGATCEGNMGVGCMMRVAGAAGDTRALSLNFNMRVVWMACYTGT